MNSTMSPVSSSPTREGLVSELLRLLSDATASIDRRPEIAAHSIRRALDLLRSGSAATASLPPGRLQPRGGLAPWQLAKAKEYIAAHIADRLSDAILADLVRLSVGHFTRAFKASVGMSPHSYIVNRRLQASKEMMLRGDASLADISVACGLSDQSHLCHVFRRRIGLTPGTWLQGQREAVQGRRPGLHGIAG